MSDTYKGWSITFDYPPIPCRNLDWSATHPNYDAEYMGEELGFVGNGLMVTAATREELCTKIDEFMEGRND